MSQLLSLEKNVNLLIDILEKDYNNLKLKNLFEKETQKKGVLKFGYVCPGAIKTVNFIKENVQIYKVDNIFKKVKKYTDALFFVELIVLYHKYIDKNLVEKINKVLKNESCKVAKALTKLITNQFTELPIEVSQNLPDNFYHMRHQELICNNNEQMVENRINFLKKLYKSNKDKPKCSDAKDNVSGCRDCCSSHYTKNSIEYNKCVDNCMKKK